MALVRNRISVDDEAIVDRNNAAYGLHQLPRHRFPDANRAVAAIARHFRQGLRQGDGWIFRGAREHCSGPVHRGDAARDVSGDDRPGNPVADSRLLQDGACAAWIEQARMAGALMPH
jgi:hypothetical protein